MLPPDAPKPNQYLRYSGLAFQMMAIIGVCVWIGLKLDERLRLSGPWLTLALLLVGVVGAMYRVIKEVNQP